MRVDIEKYIQDCDIYIKSKVQSHKSYVNMQSIPIPTYKWNNFYMDFVIGLSKSKNWQEVKSNLILIIVNRLTKMVHYELVLTTLDV